MAFLYICLSIKNKMDYKYEIPIREHYLYFLRTYGVQSPYKLSLTDLFGRVVLHEMKKGLYHFPLRKEFDYPVLEVFIPRYLQSHRITKTILSPKSIQGIDSYLRTLFYQTMIDHVLLRQSIINESKKKSLKSFFHLHKLDETDLKIETLYKYLRRFYEKNGTDLYLTKSVA